MARASHASFGKGLGKAVLACGWPTSKKTVQAHERAWAIQLQRIAQLQADIDRMRGDGVELKSPPTS
jgi:hypothetical protein